MQAYLVRRLLLAVPTFVGITILVFIAIRLVPGDTVDQLSAGGVVSAEGKAQIRHTLGLDRPWYRQYGVWVGELLHGDLGHSLDSGRPIGPDLGQLF